MDINTLVKQLRVQRFKQLAVIRTPFQEDPKLLVIASSFNQRHLDASTEVLNKFYKNNIKNKESGFVRISSSPGWNVIDFDSIVLHLLLPHVREKYDIEQLWCVGEEYDELINKPKEEPVVANYRYFAEKLKEEEEKEANKQTDSLN